MTVSAKISPFVPGQPSTPRVLAPPTYWPQRSNGFKVQPKSSAPPGFMDVAGANIYVVDDDEALVELYTSFLNASGYRVRSFSDRTRALAALIVDKNLPDLLLMDHRGHRMTSEYFIRCCLVVNPKLRILMASGLNSSEIRLPSEKPHRFIQKPFTLQELLHEVEATLKE